MNSIMIMLLREIIIAERKAPHCHTEKCLVIFVDRCVRNNRRLSGGL